MAELTDCEIVQDTALGGLTPVDVDIAPNHMKLYIKPDNSQEGLIFAVKASDFTDYTHLLPAEDIVGIAAGSGAGGLGITLQDTIPNDPYNLDNQVEIIVDIDDDFTINQDTVIKVDIGGRAVAQASRDVIVALRTDFDYQVRGGRFSFFDSGASTDLDFAGYAGVAKTTFTPHLSGAGGGPVSDPLNNTFNGVTTGVPTSSSYNLANDFQVKDDIIYVRKTVNVGEWTKIGTINVQIDTTVENTAIGLGKIPSDLQGEYGFIARNPNDAWNSFQAPSAISKDPNIYGGMKDLAESCHQLRPKDADAYEMAIAEQDGTVAIDSGLAYTYDDIPSISFDGNLNPTTAFGGSTLTRSWTREWWFKYPNTSELEEFGSISDAVFWHSTSEMNNKNFNQKNDLSLSGFLVAAPNPVALYTINEIQVDACVQCGWSAMNLLNAGLPEVSEENQDGLDDFAYVIPITGNANGWGDQYIQVKGTPGATFTVEIEEVAVEEFTTGRSLGDGTVGTFRNMILWDEDWGSTNEAGEMGSSTELTISADSGGVTNVYLPQMNFNSTDHTKNFYLRVIAGSETTISQTAPLGGFGADIESDVAGESFTQGLNWTGGPGNTAQIRLRQNPNTYVDLIPSVDGFNFGNVQLVANAGDMSGNSITGVQLWESYHNANGGEQNIHFKFCIKGTGGYFKFKEQAYMEEQSGFEIDWRNNDTGHEAEWGDQHPCLIGSEEDGACSLMRVNHFNFNMPQLKTQLWSHLYPATISQGSNLLSGGSDDFITETMAPDNYWDTWLSDWSLNSGNHSFIDVGAGSSFVQIARTSPGGLSEAGLYQDFNTVVGQTYNYRIRVGATNNGGSGTQVGKIQIRGLDDGSVPGTNTSVTYHTINIHVANANTTYTGTFTAEKPETRVYLTHKNPNVGSTVQYGIVAFWTEAEVEDHGQSTNGIENVSIYNLKAVKGQVTNPMPENWNGTMSGIPLNIDNSADFDDYLTVIGTLKVNDFGDLSNTYTMDLSHVAEYIV